MSEELYYIDFIQDVFGVQTAAQIDIDKTKLIERDNPLSRQG